MQGAHAEATEAQPVAARADVCLASGSPSGRLRLARVHRAFGVAVCSPSDPAAPTARMALALDVSAAELAILRRHLSEVPAWLLVSSAELASGDTPAWVYQCGGAIGDSELIALVRAVLSPPAHAPPVAAPSPRDVNDARAARDVLDAVRELSMLVDPEAAASALVRAQLSLTAADRAWCWFYDAEGGLLFDGSAPDAPQLPAVRGLVALSARARLELAAAHAAQHPCFGGDLDTLHLGLEDRVLCQPITAPDGVCHAVLVVARGPTRDMFSEAERTALATLGRYAGSAIGQLALRSQIDQLIGEADTTFRREALDAQESGSEQGDVVRISPPWVQRAYWVLCALVAAVFVFLFVGRVSQYASGAAVIRAENRVEVVTNVAGTVEAVLVKAGDSVRAGQELARLYSEQESQSVTVLDEQWEAQLRHYLLEPGSESVRQTLASLRSQRQVARQRMSERQVRAPRAGVVGEVHIRVGSPLAPGEVVASVIDSKPTFSVVAFMPANDAPQIHEGMPLRLEVVGYPYAYVQLRVSSVTREAAGQATVNRLLGPLLADTLGPMPATVMVEARLDRDHFRIDGRELYFSEGMPARAEVEIRSELIALALVPWLRRVVP